MSALSEYLASLGVSPLLVGLIAGFLLGLSVRGGARRDRPPAATATLTSEFGGHRIVVTAGGTTRELDPGRSAAVLRALDEKRKIEAVTLMREATGLGLKDSKDAVEAVQVARTGGTA